MTVVFELAWPREYGGRGEEWFTIGHDPDGQWWFDGWWLGRIPVSGGPEHVAAFARWLLAEPPTGRYEKEFALVKEEKPISDFWSPRMLMSIDVLFERERDGGPEHLLLYPDGYFPEMRMSAHICDELAWEEIDRDVLHAQATALLEAVLALPARGNQEIMQPSEQYATATPTEPLIRADIGMLVVDSAGAEAGSVSAVQGPGTDVRPDTVAGIAEVLMGTGYLRIDGTGALSNDTYASGDQIADVEEGEPGVVRLRVDRAALHRAAS